jgi:tripartite ATP-independent transporter DctP family solute receptor
MHRLNDKAVRSRANSTRPMQTPRCRQPERSKTMIAMTGRQTMAVVAAGALLCVAAASEAQQVRWRASGSFPAGHSTSIAMETFKKEVARLSKNTIQVDLFPNNVLGGAFEQVDQLRTGQIQMAWGGLSFYDKLAPDVAAATLPFAATSYKQAFCQIDSEFGRYMEDRMAEKGVLIIGWGNIGARHVTNNRRPIKSVEDVRGLKIRTPSGQAWELTFRALGANPTPIDIKELYQALQQGVVDGQENPYDNMLVRKFHEVQKYLSNTGHFFDWSGYMVNKAAFDNLSPDQQKAVRQAMATTVAQQREISERENKTARDGLVKGGMQYDELSPAELAKFREATRPVYQEMRKRLGDKVMDLAEAAIKRCGSVQ